MNTSSPRRFRAVDYADRQGAGVADLLLRMGPSSVAKEYHPDPMEDEADMRSVQCIKKVRSPTSCSPDHTRRDRSGPTAPDRERRGARRRRAPGARPAPHGRRHGSSSPAATTSMRSVSTGHDTSVPSVCAPPSQEGPRTLVGASGAHDRPPARAEDDDGATAGQGSGSLQIRDATMGQHAGAGAEEGEAGPSRGGRDARPANSLRPAMQPPASQRSRASAPMLGMVVVPRSPELQAQEDALSTALLALVLGTRPAVTTAMVANQLRGHFGIDDSTFSVRRTRPDDFIVRFTRQEDLDVVLRSPWPAALEPHHCGLGRVVQVPGSRRHQGNPRPRSFHRYSSGPPCLILR